MRQLDKAAREGRGRERPGGREDARGAMSWRKEWRTRERLFAGGQEGGDLSEDTLGDVADDLRAGLPKGPPHSLPDDGELYVVLRSNGKESEELR